MATSGTRGTITIPEAEHSIPATPKEEMDRAVEELREGRKAWCGLDATTRIALIDRMLEDTARVAENWVEEELARKRVDPDTPAAMENWYSPVLLLRSLFLLRKTLQDIEEHGRPQLPGDVYTRPNGQVVVDAFPLDAYDRLIFPLTTAEVWLQPHVTLEEAHERLGEQHTERAPVGDVAFVLGAGNIAAIPANDAISKLFLENEVVVMKMNPVNEFVGPYLEEALGALIDADALRVVYGGAEEGAYLVDHPGVDSIHMTGSDKTFETIVFGPGEEGERRKEAREPRLDKPISAELGNVTPIIVVPGPWSSSDVAFHAENIVSSKLNNAGFYCIASQVLLTHGEWGRRRELLDGIRDLLGEVEPRYPYYPGAEDRHDAFVSEHPDAETFGPTGEGRVPWTFVPDVDPDAKDDIVFNTEAFNGVLAETPLDAPRDVAAFIDQAVEFCNERLWGTLAATIIIHPRSLEDPQIAAAFERALENLRYGSIGVNHWAGVLYAMNTTPWGAFPGHDYYDIQSGIGKVHNALMLPDPEKAIVRGPFRAFPKPVWFATHSRGFEAARKLVDFQADPSPLKLPQLVWSAIRP